jgi:hypothetical protein
MHPKLLIPVVVIVTLAFCLFVMATGNIQLFALGILIPVMALLVGNPPALFMAICWTYNTTLRAPSIPGQVEVYHLLMLGAFALYVLRSATLKPVGGAFWARRWALAFAGICLLTMAVRGAGSKVLGGNTYGGARYVYILVPLLFFLSARAFRLTPRQWRWAMIGWVVSGALPALAELAYVLSNGSMQWQYRFLLPRGTTAYAMEQMQSGGLVRVTMLSRLLYLYWLPFLLLPFAGRARLAYYLFPLLSIGMGGFTGHRAALVGPLSFIWTFGFLKARRKLAYVAKSLLAGAAVLFLAGQLAFLLPQSFQRMLSIVPFANISPTAAADARGTITWRIQLWKEAVRVIPDYLWVGKGFAYDIQLDQAQDIRFTSQAPIWWALVQTAYHQGILSLLIGLGLAGLTSGLAFLFAACWRHYAKAQEPWGHESNRRVHFAVFVMLLTGTLSYIVIYGDVFVSYPNFFLFAGLLEALRSSDAGPTATPVPASPSEPPKPSEPTTTPRRPLPGELPPRIRFDRLLRRRHPSGGGDSA